MDDEPLSNWAERRDAKIDRLRATPVTCGEGPKGSHVKPDAPRVIERWNGHAWEPHTIASNLAEAQRILYPDTAETSPAPGPAPNPLGPGTGKHRKPQAPRSDRR
ncbi:hypothetical protein HRW18_03845 [Streptomyces lunaelactis]|uniref:DUF6087 family protein n=1 Tax=Streptomyces lunaelactis TaxID=1535768 RepID=UPI001585861D|nr:DUF6087 family protein [Streptomyces lunaelactis]NUK07157.1 hypothetical protein [Streptomyces lunaelactis]NUK14911.1 hypothetical protein [Streptomyces lunaelactis]NUK22105.1 hypothetical protein [Streptomyces lunaelactis]NUK50135.1 hypothetical protein [Streptomyces lunaelactis]NUK55975.1 hypothetical protein [Streptomyces lunaelactis]